MSTYSYLGLGILSTFFSGLRPSPPELRGLKDVDILNTYSIELRYLSNQRKVLCGGIDKQLF